MKLKKDRGRFTVRFDMENPDHVRAVEYLERQRDRGKAQYLADAILCYEKAATKSFQQTDRALIEQIVQEYLESRPWDALGIRRKKSHLYLRRQ